jgi:hypothetical protein
MVVHQGLADQMEGKTVTTSRRELCGILGEEAIKAAWFAGTWMTLMPTAFHLDQKFAPALR